MNVCAPESHSALIESQFYYHCRVLCLFISCASDTCIFVVLFQLEIHKTETVIGIGVPEINVYLFRRFPGVGMFPELPGYIVLCCLVPVYTLLFCR